MFDDDTRAQLFRAFADATSGSELADLRGLANLSDDRVSQALALRDSDLDPRVVDLAGQLRHTNLGGDLGTRLTTVRGLATDVDVVALPAALRAPMWFLKRAADGGLPLTGDGDLHAAVVEAAAEVVPTMATWRGPRDHAVFRWPLVMLRRALESYGLLRPHAGALVATPAGAAAVRDPRLLWDHLAARLVPHSEGGRFEVEATLLLLAYAGSSGRAVVPLTKVVRGLRFLRWHPTNGTRLTVVDVRRLPAYTVLANVGQPKFEPGGERVRLSPAAATLARAALRR